MAVRRSRSYAWTLPTPSRPAPSAAVLLPPETVAGPVFSGFVLPLKVWVRVSDRWGARHRRRHSNPERRGPVIHHATLRNGISHSAAFPVRDAGLIAAGHALAAIRR